VGFPEPPCTLHKRATRTTEADPAGAVGVLGYFYVSKQSDTPTLDQ